jgi:putative Mg2+ transporter-C (MgtC) family protein
VPTQLDFFLRASLALGLGAAIGLERQFRRHEAGMKTNALVALGTALYVNMSFHFPAPDRIVAQIVTGVGFLGAGMIMRDGEHVRGLNTAATLWCSAAIGMLCGQGDRAVAINATLLVIAANVILRYIEGRVIAWLDRPKPGSSGSSPAPKS